MNTKDKKDLEQVLARLDQQDTSRSSQISDVQSQLSALKSQSDKDHAEIDKKIGLINKGLLHPQKGVWAHLNLNTAFRTTMSKALYYMIPAVIVLVGTGVVSLIYMYSSLQAATGTGP